MLRGCILFPPGMEDGFSDDVVHQIGNGWWMSLLHGSWAPTPVLQIKGDQAVITRLVSKRSSNTKTLRLTAKTSFSSSCHLHWHFPDRSWPSSPLSELAAHTTTPQNMKTGVGSLTPMGMKILCPPLAQQILFLSAGSSSCLIHHCLHVLPKPPSPPC